MKTINEAMERLIVAKLVKGIQQQVNEIIKKVGNKYGLETKFIKSFDKVLSIIIPPDEFHEMTWVSVGYERTNLGAYTLSIRDGMLIVKEKIQIGTLEEILSFYVKVLLEQRKLESQAMEEKEKE